MSGEYYIGQLYPLQDKVLHILESTDSGCYLTGGTALSRCYLHHRYSDDLDFFCNQRIDFKKNIEIALNKLKKYFPLEIAITEDTFVRCFVTRSDVTLKIEFVNDVPFRLGDSVKTDLFLHTDNIHNILSNKISALSRDEPKDFADIWFIALSFEFNWQEMIAAAKNKDMWVEENQLAILFDEFDVKRLKSIRWIAPIDLEKARIAMQSIADDIVLGRNNTLYS